MQPLAIYLSAIGRHENVAANSSHGAFVVESPVANDDICGRGMKKRKLDSSQDAAFDACSLSSLSDLGFQKNNTGPYPSIISDTGSVETVKRSRQLQDVSERKTNQVGLPTPGDTFPNQSTSNYALSNPISKHNSKMHGISKNTLAEATMLHQRTSAMWSKNGWLARARLAARRKALFKQPRSASYARLFMLQQKILSEMMTKAWNEGQRDAR